MIKNFFVVLNRFLDFVGEVVLMENGIQDNKRKRKKK